MVTTSWTHSKYRAKEKSKKFSTICLRSSDPFTEKVYLLCDPFYIVVSYYIYRMGHYFLDIYCVVCVKEVVTHFI